MTEARAVSDPVRVLLVDLDLPELHQFVPEADEAVILLQESAGVHPSAIAAWPVRGFVLGSPTPHAVSEILRQLRDEARH